MELSSAAELSFNRWSGLLDAIRASMLHGGRSHPLHLAARRVLARAEVHVGSRPSLGGPISVDVEYQSRTDLPLVGALFPDPDLHAHAVMRVER